MPKCVFRVGHAPDSSHRKVWKNIKNPHSNSKGLLANMHQWPSHRCEKWCRIPNEKTYLDVRQQHGVHNLGGHKVRVHVGSGAAVLKVALALSLSHTGDTDGGTAVSNTVGELVDALGFVLASQAALVTNTVELNVFLVLLFKLADAVQNGSKAALLAHGESAEVGVAASAVPVTGDGLGVVADKHAEVLTHAEHDVAGKPEAVTGVDALARTNLVLPLARHHFSVAATDGDASVEASTVVGIHNVAAKSAVDTNTAVVGALRAREAALRPAKGSGAVRKEQGVLLLNAEPRLLTTDGFVFENGASNGAGVSVNGGAIGLEALAQHEDVLSAAERIRGEFNGAKKDLRVVARGLLGGGTIKVPLRELLNGFGDEVQSAGLAAEVIARAANPNVLGLHHSFRHWEVHVALVNAMIKGNVAHFVLY